MAAMVVGAVDQHATHAHVAHLAEGDFLGARCEHYFDSALSVEISVRWEQNFLALARWR
jgi:hypothetical protein